MSPDAVEHDLDHVEVAADASAMRFSGALVE